MIPNFEPDDVFEPSRYAGVRRRRDTAEALPGWCYTGRAATSCRPRTCAAAELQ